MWPDKNYLIPSSLISLKISQQKTNKPYLHQFQKGIKDTYKKVSKHRQPAQADLNQKFKVCKNWIFSMTNDDFTSGSADCWTQLLDKIVGRNWTKLLNETVGRNCLTKLLDEIVGRNWTKLLDEVV